MDNFKGPQAVKITRESNLYSAIEKVGKKLHYQKDEMIYFQEDAADQFYLIKSGWVRLFLTSREGHEITLKILDRDQLFGEASHFSHTPRLTSANALTDIELLAVNRDLLLPHLSQNPNWMEELVTFMAQTIRLLSIQVYSMAFLSSDKKVAHILVQLGTYFKEKESATSYKIDYTHQEISELIGIARVTTTKVLKLFEKKGWVSLEYRNVCVLDETALKQYLLS